MREHLNKSQEALLCQAQRWLRSDAAVGMGRMSLRLSRVARDSKLHRALLREVILAKRLAAAGFSVRSDVRTPSGRSCDLVAVRGAIRLHIHVKCLENESAERPARIPRIPASLRRLEEINRRLLIEVQWKSGLNSSALQRLAATMRSFLLRASVGDECLIRSRGGVLHGRCRVRSPRDPSSVALTCGISDDHRATVDRMHRLMRKARAQFLPGGENVIVLFSPKSTRWIFQLALLGTPVERWDAYPRRGERVALGHADDGLWHPGAADESRIAVWGSLESLRDDSTAWIRGGVAAVIRAACAEVFSKVNPPTGL